MRVLFNFEPEPVPGLGVPTVFEFAKTDEQKKVLTFFASNVLLGRPIMAPPGVPKDRVALLRRAFEAAMKDPALLKEAESMSFEISPLTRRTNRGFGGGNRGHVAGDRQAGGAGGPAGIAPRLPADAQSPAPRYSRT